MLKFISCICPLLLPSIIYNACKVDNHDDICGFLAASLVLWEISDACVDTKLRDIKATGSISSDRGQPHARLCRVCASTKTLVVASEQGYTNFVCTSLQAQLPTKLNQKFTKSMPRFGAFTQKNAYVRIWG